MRRAFALLLLLLVTAPLTACGASGPVTVTDANTVGSSDNADANAPFSAAGADAAHRALAIALARGRLAEAAELAQLPRSPATATLLVALAAATRDDLRRSILPRLDLASPAAGRAFETSLDRFVAAARVAPSSGLGSAVAAARRAVDDAESRVVAAAHDRAFASATLVLVLQELSLRYQHATLTGSGAALGYQDARALVLTARDDLLPRMDGAAARRVDAPLAALMRQALSPPLPSLRLVPADPVDRSASSIGDQVTATSGVDASLPAPARDSVAAIDHLRRALSAAAAAHDPRLTGSMLHAARMVLVPRVASAIAVVDPGVLDDLEYGLLTAERAARLGAGAASASAVGEALRAVDTARRLVDQEVRQGG